MSDKRVTYRCPLCREVTHGEQGDICLDCEKWLRENKWINLDDVVEGKTVQDGPCQYPDRNCILDDCEKAEDEHCYLTRPMLVKDLISG